MRNVCMFIVMRLDSFYQSIYTAGLSGDKTESVLPEYPDMPIAQCSPLIFESISFLHICTFA